MALLNKSLRGDVIARAEGRCQVCGYPFEAALVVHHIVPVEFGGSDEESNFVCVCENCHKLIHVMSAKTPRLPVSAKEFVPYGSHRKLSALASRARDARLAFDGRDWKAAGEVRDLVPAEDAAASVARANRYSDEEAEAVREALFLALRAIPKDLRSRCSYRLVKNGQVLSVAIMNYLVFRAPAGSVMTSSARANADCWLLWPCPWNPKSRIKLIGSYDYTYAYFEGGLARLPLVDVRALTETDWRMFGEACWAAATARKSRSWPSNVDPSAAWRARKLPTTAKRRSGARAKKV